MDNTSSKGPEIVSLERDGSVLRVATSPARSIVLAGPGSKSRQVHGDGIVEAEFDLAPFAGSWCRLVVTAADGKRAWTQPEYL